MAAPRHFDHDRIRRLSRRGLGPTAIARRVGCSVGHACLVARGKLPTHYQALGDEELAAMRAYHVAKLTLIDAEIERRRC